MPGWFRPGSRAPDRSCSSRATSAVLPLGNGRESSLVIIGSFDSFAPRDAADVEVDTAVVGGMVVARFVDLAQVGIVVDRHRAAFFDLGCQRFAQALVTLVDQAPMANMDRLGGLVFVVFVVFFVAGSALGRTRRLLDQLR